MNTSAGCGRLRFAGTGKRVQSAECGNSSHSGKPPVTSLRLWCLVFGLWPYVTRAATNSSSGDEFPPLLPPRGEIQPTFWEQHGFWVVLLSVLALALISIVLWLLTRPKPAAIVPPAIAARRSLEPLRQQPEDGQVLSQVSQILRHFFAAAFSLPSGELTTSEFCHAIHTAEQVGLDLSSKVSLFLQQCDERKFSVSPPQPPLGAVDRATELIDQAEARRIAAADRARQVPNRDESPTTRVGS